MTDAKVLPVLDATRAPTTRITVDVHDE